MLKSLPLWLLSSLQIRENVSRVFNAGNRDFARVSVLGRFLDEWVRSGWLFRCQLLGLFEQVLPVITRHARSIILKLLAESYWSNRCHDTFSKDVRRHLVEWLLIRWELSKEDFLRLFVLDELAHLLGQILLLHLLA